MYETASKHNFRIPGFWFWLCDTCKDEYLQFCFLTYSQTHDASSGSPSVSCPGGNTKLEKDLKQSLFFMPVLKKEWGLQVMNFADSLYFHEFWSEILVVLNLIGKISALQKRTRTKVLVLWVLNFTVSILGHLCNFSEKMILQKNETSAQNKHNSS